MEGGNAERESRCTGYESEVEKKRSEISAGGEKTERQKTMMGKLGFERLFLHSLMEDLTYAANS